ncbi:MarR family winged helix-turn-helix transcriptional regulator [Cellulomonas soli]
MNPRSPADTDEAAFAAAVHAVVLRLRRLGERRLGLDLLPLSELEVLAHVIDHPGATVTAVARELGLQSSNVSTTVQHLVTKGLMERHSDPADGRRTLLQPTAKAQDDRRRIDGAWTAVLGQFLDELPDADRAAALAATSALARLAEIDLG